MSGRRRTDVAVFVPGLAAGGGAEKTALTAAEGFARAGMRVTCFTDAETSLDQLRRHFGLSLAGVSLSVLPTPRLPTRVPQTVKDVVRDVKHVRAVRATAPRLFINMKFKSELPGAGATNWYYVHFPHRPQVRSRSGIHGVYLSTVALVRRALLLRGAATFTDSYQLILANSEFTRSHVQQRWGRDASTVYPPCEQVGAAAAAGRSRTILSVGRFQAGGPTVPYKAQDALIQTFAEMPDLIEAGWTLHLVGARGTSAADTAFFEQISRQASGLPVRLHPDASHDLLSELSSRATLYWHAQGFGSDLDHFPEAQEHFGISTVEAMAAGAVPLVYGTAGPAEVVQDEPELTWRTREELAQKTRELLSSGRWQHWHDWGMARAAEFSADAFSGRLADLYETQVGTLPGPVGEGS